MYRLAERAHAEMAKGPQHLADTTGRSTVVCAHEASRIFAPISRCCSKSAVCGLLGRVLEAF